MKAQRLGSLHALRTLAREEAPGRSDPRSTIHYRVARANAAFCTALGSMHLVQE